MKLIKTFFIFYNNTPKNIICYFNTILQISTFENKMQKQQINNTQQLDNIFYKIPQSIIANFHTYLTQYQIGQNTQIDISTQLDQDVLNKIVKEILESTVDQQTLDKVQFDFLVNDKLLRGKLKSHLVRYEISGEQVVRIEYFISFKEFQQMKQSPVQDWISSICEVMGLDGNIGVFSGLFDGSIAFHDKTTKKQPKYKAKIHQAPIKSIKSLPSQKQNAYYIISGGIDEQLRVSKFEAQKQIQVISINNHEGTVLAIDFNPALQGHICSAGSQGALHIWKIPQNFLEDQSLNQVKTQKKKKRKTNRKFLPHQASQTLHIDAINSVCWLNSTSVSTGSSDHSIKITDVQKMRQQRTFLTKDSITTGIDFSNNILFTSHEDGYIRTWDLKSNSTSPLQTFKSHSKFSSCVKSHTHSHVFASGSYDQTVKIWDTRSVFPLQTIMTNYDKVFAIAWKSQNQLVSGGSNPFVTFHSI